MFPLKKIFRSFFIILLIPFVGSTYNIVSNFGRTGLLEIPTAYTYPDGTIVVGTSYVYPYLRGFIGTGFFPGLEMGAVVTDIRNIKMKGSSWRGYGDYKDKAFFIKYQILPEMGKFPAIAVGWDDFHGTRLFDTKYIVVSKYIDYGIPQNVSVGYAKGKLLNGLFFGSEILLHPKWSFLVEYAPINKDKLKGLRKEKIKWKYNFGLKWQPWKYMQVVLSYQRGNQYGLNINFLWPMGEKWLPHIPKYFRLTKEDVELIKRGKQTEFYKKALERLEMVNADVYIVGDTLYIEFENRGYYFESVAIKKALLVLRVLRFPNVRKVKILLKENNVVVSEITIPGKWVNYYITQSVSFKELLKHSKISFSKEKSRLSTWFTRPSFDIFIKTRAYLNEASGPFKYGFFLFLGLKEKFLNQFRLDFSLYKALMSNIHQNVKPALAKPIRSDIGKFLGVKKIQISTLSVSYIDKFLQNNFLGVSVGYSELMFAGIGGDFIHFFGNGRFAAGLGGDYVYKRDPNKVFGLKNWTFHDEYVSFYYRMRKPEMQFTVKAGRFLAGDKGVRIEVSRIVHGMEVGFWYTYSDTSNFSGPNKDYHDKGVFLRIPLRIWKLKDTQMEAGYALAPWTRDVGQLAGRPFDLYRELVKKLPFYIEDTADEEE